MVVPSLSFDCPHRPRSGSCGSHCRSRYSFRGVHSLHPSLHGRMYTTVSSDPMAPRPSVSEDANAGSTTLNVSDGRSRLPQGRRPSRSSTGCRHGPWAHSAYCVCLRMMMGDGLFPRSLCCPLCEACGTSTSPSCLADFLQDRVGRTYQKQW